MGGSDLNRAGTPLLEIVTEPDMRSSAEAVATPRNCTKIVTWIGLCDGNARGQLPLRRQRLRAQTWCPLRHAARDQELEQFQFMQQAIDYEVRWQIEQLEDGHAIEQATVLFNPDTGQTSAMRSRRMLPITATSQTQIYRHL